MRDIADETLFSAPLDIRFVGMIAGRYSLSRGGSNEGSSVVYACRTQSLSPNTALVVGPVAHVGQGIGLLLDHVGLLKGQVSRRFKGGFQVDLTGGAEDQKKLAAKINWLKKRSTRQAKDKRDAPRRVPRNPTAYFYVDDEEHECFVIDVSLSGAGLSSTNRPPIGSTLKIGTIVSQVIRHMEVGFGVRFDVLQTASSLETGLNFRRDDVSVDRR